jgi:hypothetical protein
VIAYLKKNWELRSPFKNQVETAITFKNVRGNCDRLFKKELGTAIAL